MPDKRELRQPDFNSLSDAEKEVLAERALCLRLLDIDPACGRSTGKGCPAIIAAFPMIRDFRMQKGWLGEGKRLESKLICRLMCADGQGRACEINELRHVACRYLEATDNAR